MRRVSELYAVLFTTLLKDDRIEKAKEYITADMLDERGYNSIVNKLCVYGPDDPELLQYLLDRGAVLDCVAMLLTSALDSAKSRLVRAILDRVDRVASSIFVFESAAKRLCVLHLLDAGVRVYSCGHLGDPNWIQYLTDTRHRVRTASLVVLCAKRARSNVMGINGVDILRVIARCVWGTRGLVETWNREDCVARHTRSATKKTKKY